MKLEADGSYRLKLGYFRHHKEKVAYEWENGAPVFSNLFSDKLAELLGPMREEGEELSQKHKDIAHSIQAMYEEAFFHLLNKLHVIHGLDAVTLAGGYAMNSVANGKVTRKTPFKQVYIQSATGDAGGAIGSAFSVWNDLNPSTQHISIGEERGTERFLMDHAFWGPSFTDDEIKTLLEPQAANIEAQGCAIDYIEDENPPSVNVPLLLLPKARSSVGFRAASSGDLVRLGTTPSSAIRAAPT